MYINQSLLNSNDISNLVDGIYHLDKSLDKELIVSVLIIIILGSLPDLKNVLDGAERHPLSIKQDGPHTLSTDPSDDPSSNEVDDSNDHIVGVVYDAEHVSRITSDSPDIGIKTTRQSISDWLKSIFKRVNNPNTPSSKIQGKNVSLRDWMSWIKTKQARVVTTGTS